jgi:hypothetical protein
MVKKALSKSQHLIMEHLEKGMVLQATVVRSAEGKILHIGKFWWNQKPEGLSRNASITTLQDLRSRRLILFRYTKFKCTVLRAFPQERKHDPRTTKQTDGVSQNGQPKPPINP